MTKFNLPKFKSKFIAENNAESALEQLAQEKAIKWKQGLAIVFDTIRYGAVTSGIGATLGYLNGGDQLSIVDGAKQVLIAGVPQQAFGILLAYARFSDVGKMMSKIEEIIWVNENAKYQVLFNTITSSIMYYVSATVINKFFGANLDPAFCAQAGIVYGILETSLAIGTGSYYKKKIAEQLKRIQN